MNACTRSFVLAAALAALVSVTGGCAGDSAHESVEEPGDAPASSTTAPLGKWTLASDPGVTFDVKEGGDISGTAPCNGYFGKWTLGPEQSTLGPVGATRKMCAPDVMDREQAFFVALGKVAGHRPSAAGMVLVDSDGAVLLEFSRAE